MINAIFQAADDNVAIAFPGEDVDPVDSSPCEEIGDVLVVDSVGFHREVV
jgi:hypothetical protein